MRRGRARTCRRRSTTSSSARSPRIPRSATRRRASWRGRRRARWDEAVSPPRTAIRRLPPPAADPPRTSGSLHVAERPRARVLVGATGAARDRRRRRDRVASADRTTRHASFRPAPRRRRPPRRPGHRLQLAPPGRPADRAPEHGRHGAGRDDLGGRAASQAAPRRRTAVEGYDPVINSWKSAPDLPARLHHQMAVTYKDEMVVMGGWIPQGSDQSALLSDRVFALRGDGKWERCLRCAARGRRERPRWSATRSSSSAARTRAVWWRRWRCSTARSGARRRTYRRRVSTSRPPRTASCLRGGRARARPRRELRGARALRPGDRQLAAAARHADGPRWARRRDRGRPSRRGRRREPDAAR